MKAKFFRSAALSFAQQIGRMSAAHPGFRVALARNVASWTGELRPSVMSHSYVVKIDYTLWKRPKVWVVKPGLQTVSTGRRVPHTFPDGSVCLHLHEDWTSAMFIADTIIPWLLLWLYYYEAWLATGAWLGGGHEPKSEK